ncbi:MAG: Na+/H+ antiporter subunit D [Cryomorphaceae bacterium]|nr:MAG: Na+/H+ antiporter subunit D [Cryomorphaceae bacterium]
MSDIQIIWPIAFHLLAAVVLIGFWRKVDVQRYVSVVANFIAVGIAVWLFANVWSNGVLVMQSGSWGAPFGITFVADTFSATMVLLTAISALAVSIFSAVSISKERMRYGYFSILHFLVMGLNGAFLTGDIFNMYVWFELIIISSFVLMTLGGERPQIEGAINYVTMNLLASVIFLTAIAILYGMVGTLNMADLSLKLAEEQNRGLVNATAILFFVGFGIKSAVFPLYFWLPSSYHTPPSAIAAIFGGLLTKVGVYALLRVFSLMFIPDEFMTNMLMTIAALTMFTGGVGALVQTNIRKMFSYLIICHIGFMIAGLGMYTELALLGAVFYLIHDIIIKTNLFLVSGVILKIKGTVDMKHLGGLYDEYPKISLLVAVILFSLVGIPPLSGFWPKLFLIQAGFDTRAFVLVAFVVIASFLTLFVIAKLWSEVFWKKGSGTQEMDRPFTYFNELKPIKKAVFLAPLVLLAAVSLYIGFGAERIMQVALVIAHDLKDTSYYLQAVLGATHSNTPMP